MGDDSGPLPSWPQKAGPHAANVPAEPARELAEDEPLPWPPVARVAAARAEVEAKLTSPASLPIVRNVLGNTAVVCVSFYDETTRRARHIIAAREASNGPWTSSAIRGRFDTLKVLVQQLGVERLAPSPSSLPLSQPARRLTRLQMAGGKGGGLKEVRYEGPCGVIVTANRESWTNKNYYYLKYLFDEHLQKNCSDVDTKSPTTPSVHRTYWLPNQLGVLKGWISFDFPDGTVGLRELRIATAYVPSRDRGARQVIVEAAYDGLSEAVTMPAIDTSEDTLGSSLRVIVLPFPGLALQKLTLQLEVTAKVGYGYGPGIRSIEFWREEYVL